MVEKVFEVNNILGRKYKVGAIIHGGDDSGLRYNRNFTGLTFQLH